VDKNINTVLHYYVVYSAGCGVMNYFKYLPIYATESGLPSRINNFTRVSSV
jgi:hypothetical protein